MNESILLRPSQEVRNHVPYLEKENIQNFLDVEIKSSFQNYSIRVNKIMLATLSDCLRPILIDLYENDEISITCDFTSEELILLKNYISEGEWPYKSEKSSRQFLKSFGIDFNKRTANGVEKVQPFKIEDITNYVVDMDFDFSDDYKDSNFDLEHSVPSKSNSRNKRSDIASENMGSKSDIVIVQETKVCGYPKFPSNIFPTKTIQKRQEKLRIYQQKYKEYVKIGSILPLDKEGLLNYTLPQPIESYLKYSQNNKPIPKGCGPIQCSICIFKCKTENSMIKHTQKYHVLKYTCPTCEKGFSFNVWFKFLSHMYQHSIANDSTLHQCINCGYKTDVLTRIDLHRHTHGPYHNNECSQCSARFESHDAYKYHVETSHFGIWKIRCGICPMVFDSQKETNKHIIDVHRNKKPNIICEHCAKSFSGVNQLKTHLGSKKCKKSDRPILQCSLCAFRTQLQAYLKKHIRTVHEKLPCEVCGKLVPKSRMKVHMTIFHTDNEDKPYKCAICGKGYATKVTYLEHSNIHTGKRPYQCDFCEKRFSSSGNMYMHRRSSHMGYKRSK